MASDQSTAFDARAPFPVAAWNRMCDRIDALNRADAWLQRATPAHVEPEPQAERAEGHDWQGHGAVGAPAVARSSPSQQSAVGPVISAVRFDPDDLYMGDAFYTFVGGSRRTLFSGTWSDLCRWLSRSTEGDPWLRPDLAKRAAGAWVPGRYTGTFGRKDLPQEFQGTWLLVADVDHGDPYAVADALAPYKAIVHTTYKHQPACPRCRAVLLLANEVTNAKHYDIALRAVADYLNAKGFRCPAGDATLGKLAFLPMHQRGVSPVFLTTNGNPLDVARLVRADEDRRRLVPPTPTWTGASRDHAHAVLHAAQRVATAPEGERHNTRRNLARWLSELGVPDNEIRTACLDAGCDDNAIRTVDWAITKGREKQP